MAEDERRVKSPGALDPITAFMFGRSETGDAACGKINRPVGTVSCFAGNQACCIREDKGRQDRTPGKQGPLHSAVPYYRLKVTELSTGEPERNCAQP